MVCATGRLMCVNCRGEIDGLLEELVCLHELVVSATKSLASRSNPWPTITRCLCCCLIKRSVVMAAYFGVWFYRPLFTQSGNRMASLLYCMCLKTYACLTRPLMHSGYYVHDSLYR
jgi:hypothetical protein